VALFLDPGEQVRGGFNAGSGPFWAVWLAGQSVLEDPRLLLLLPLVLLLRVRSHRVVITDRSIVVVRLSLLSGRPRDVEVRLPRRTQLRPFEGRGWIELGGMRMFAPEVDDKRAVQDADEEMGFPRPIPSIW
jgi:hypothetical protein